MGLEYRYFTILLHVIGICWPKKKPVYFHLQTWIPNLLYLILVTTSIVELVYQADDEVDDEVPSKQTTNFNITGQQSNDDDLGDEAVDTPIETKSVKSIAVVLFFALEKFLNRVVIFVYLFRRRQMGFNIRSELKQIETSFEKQPQYTRRIKKYGISFLSLISVVFLVLLIIELTEMFLTDQPAWLSFFNVIQSLGLTITEAVCSFAIEGYLIYYSIMMDHYVEEFNDSLGIREVPVEINDKEEQCLIPRMDYKETRLKLSSINATFQKCNNFISPMLAFSMCVCLITVCFGVFHISNNLSGEFEGSEWTLFYIIVKMFVSVIKIFILCIVSDYCNKKVDRTFSFLSGLKPSEKADADTNQEVSLLNLTKHSLSFRFTLGGFCDLRKPLLPTIAGVVITYTVILCDN